MICFVFTFTDKFHWMWHQPCSFLWAGFDTGQNEKPLGSRLSKHLFIQKKRAIFLIHFILSKIKLISAFVPGVLAGTDVWWHSGISYL